MSIYVGLPGVKGELRPGNKHFASSMTGLLGILLTERVAAAASDYGSVTVWIDDAGQYRGGLYRFGSRIEEVCFLAKSDLRDWLRETMPRLKTEALGQYPSIQEKP